ncbi:MAG: formate dehydrogenase major subunit [Frankiaceae bacterium]|nr:formate dehydrogenase major subunit [Frankiaceae bacterium]
MAECHPVGFQWVMEAKARGATVIHVDPRFTRTSAVADIHVGIRVGTDIAFLGGLINHVLSNELWFKEYVTAFTNASLLVSEDFQDTEELDGLFSGWNETTRTYDPASWQYEGADVGSASGDRQSPRPGEGSLAHRSQAGQPDSPETGAGDGSQTDAEKQAIDEPRQDLLGKHGSQPERDDTLQNPRCVINVLRRHYARYTPEMVEQVCGIPPEQFRKVADALTENSGRERTGAFCYAVGWTHHTTGAQYIRTAAILQLLLGNMGRPGGGILALRGHASIQGSTDIPTLYNLLPGYMPMPQARPELTLQSFLEANGTPTGFWGHMDAYFISLLKAWWGDAATAENDYCFDYIPRLTGDHGTYTTVMDQIDGKVSGYFLLGQNPAVGSANAKLQRLGLANLDWLVVRDFSLIESAMFWKDGP